MGLSCGLPARDDEGLEAVRAQVRDQLLIDHLGFETAGFRMLRRPGPIADDVRKLLGRHARMPRGCRGRLSTA